MRNQFTAEPNIHQGQISPAAGLGAVVVPALLFGIMSYIAYDRTRPEPSLADTTVTAESDVSTEFPISTDVQTLNLRLKSGEQIKLLDCRLPEESAFVHLPGSMFIPLHEISQRIDELQPHKDDEIVVYCHFGGRSFRVVSYLRSQGFAKAVNLDGGIDEWSEFVDPTLPRY